MRLFLLLLLLPCFVLSQENTNQKSHFVALYTIGELWDKDKKPNEQEYFKEHSSFLSRLRDEKKVILGARYSDTGMIIVLADHLEDAKNILFQDIALQQKLFTVEIHPFNPFYKGCLE
ncbi:YciI family protein [Flagellimonas sp.]|uniref:YciI family protein n=1 Tax=Flagellimonas sp. TaxID=2058762 RepID=UPI003B51064B